VGTAEFRAEIDGERYAVSFSGGIRGLARLFSDARTSAEAVGRVDADRLQPQDYRHLWYEDEETETVAMRFADRGVTDIALDPPLRHPERYVPMTAENRADALDPMSAFLWPAPAGAAPETCSRTLPLVDGRRRFDIALSFARTETFATRDGSFSAPAVVCAFRYRPIAGHRPGSRSTQFLADNDDMAVWMAPAGDGFMAPVRIDLRTRLGRIVLEATRIQAN
jgi:hypothetical protein